jgi:cysteine desulfurase
MNTIYLDHQATTPTTGSVLKAMQPYWNEKYGNPHSSEHIIGMIADRKIEEAKEQISSHLCCEPDEIFFTSGATESNNTAIYSLCTLSRYRSAKQVIITSIEHKCIIEAAKHWTSVFGLDLKVLDVDREGFVDLSQLREFLKTPTLFCSIMAANNEIGTIQKLDKISEIIWAAGSLLHSDAAQALKTDLEYDVCEYVDAASFSGHKIGGPQGIGCIYISASIQQEFTPLILGGGQQNGIRSGTLPLPLCVGLGQAFEDLSSYDFAKIRQTRNMLFKSLEASIDGIRLNGPSLENRHACNLNIYFPNTESTDLIACLQPHIAVSSGSACGSGNIESSYVLRALPTDIDVSRHSIRMSVSESTGEQDIINAVNLIARNHNS